MKNLVIRALTGAVLLTVMISAILLPPYLFGVVFLLVNMLCLYEFYALTYHLEQTKPISKWAMVGGGVLFVAVFLSEYFHSPYLIPALYVPFFTGTFVVELFRNDGTPILNVALSLLGHIYIALPMSCLCMIEGLGDADGWCGAPLVLAFFVALWVSDTGAYLTGRAFGKHKLYERVSPKKSWEGFWGGFVLAVLAGYVYHYCLGDMNPRINGKELSETSYMLLFGVVCILGTLGDLVESLFKRYFQVKDSSNMLPGHGGFLDRFDSALVASPFVYALLMAYFYI